MISLDPLKFFGGECDLGTIFGFESLGNNEKYPRALGRYVSTEDNFTT